MDVRDEIEEIDATLLGAMAVHFAKFASALDPEISGPYTTAYPPATEEHIANSGQLSGVPLPDSYKQFLRITCGLDAFGGRLTINDDPWCHNWPSLESFTPKQLRRWQHSSKQIWQPPTEGMLCFVDYCGEADGNQVLFGVGGALVDGEYPVY